MFGVDVMAPIQLVLTDDVAGVELDEGGQLRHHPCEGDVGEFGVVVAASDVGMNAWEPDLFEVLKCARFDSDKETQGLGW